MAAFVLIHGAFHGGWCWEPVTDLLRAAGHVALAPDLPGMAGDPTPVEQVTLASTADFVADLVRAQSQPVVLAGHSMGGVVISEVAERVPERLAGLVYVTGIMLPSGVSLVDSAPELGHVKVAQSADGVEMMVDLELAPQLFYNTTDEALAGQAVARLTRQPMAPATVPLNLSDERFGRTPRAYVECAQDNALPLASQRKLQQTLPCDPVITLDTDHSPFLCAPKQLADGLIGIAEQFRLRKSG
jgi:pimeloyl-ACP methyl ester carboxylesterase